MSMYPTPEQEMESLESNLTHERTRADKATSRAEGLAKELEALRAAFLASFKPLSLREMFKEDGPAAVRFWDEQCDTFCSNAQSRALEATARVAEMQDRMVAAFGEGTTAEQLVAISHEHEARVAELEKQLAEVTTDLGDAHEDGSATAAKWRNRADKAEAELARLREQPADKEEENKDLDSRLARLRALPDGIREALNKLDGLRGCLQEMSAQVDVRTAKDFLSRAEKLLDALAAPLPSAPRVDDLRFRVWVNGKDRRASLIELLGYAIEGLRKGHWHEYAEASSGAGAFAFHFPIDGASPLHTGSTDGDFLLDPRAQITGYAEPLPSAQQVGAAPVDISLGECSAWTAPAPQATPARTTADRVEAILDGFDDGDAQPAGHNPEGVEARVAQLESALAWVFGEKPDAQGRWFDHKDFIPPLSRGGRVPMFWWRKPLREMVSTVNTVGGPPPSPSRST